MATANDIRRTTTNLRNAIALDIKAALPAEFLWLDTEREDVKDIRTTAGRFVGRVEFNVRQVATTMGGEVESRSTGSVSFDPTYEAGKMSNYKVSRHGQINVDGLIGRIRRVALVVDRSAERRDAAKVQQVKDDALRESLSVDAPERAHVSVFQDVVSIALRDLTPAQARLILAAAKVALEVAR